MKELGVPCVFLGLTGGVPTLARRQRRIGEEIGYSGDHQGKPPWWWQGHEKLAKTAAEMERAFRRPREGRSNRQRRKSIQKIPPRRATFEIQVFGDGKGRGCPLGERDGSLQPPPPGRSSKKPPARRSPPKNVARIGKVLADAYGQTVNYIGAARSNSCMKERRVLFHRK